MNKTLISIVSVVALAVGVGCAADPEGPSPSAHTNDDPANAPSEETIERGSDGPESSLPDGESATAEQGCYTMYDVCVNGTKKRKRFDKCCTPLTTGGYYCYTSTYYVLTNKVCYSG